jgi:hypothetical protein
MIHHRATASFRTRERLAVPPMRSGQLPENPTTSFRTAPCQTSILAIPGIARCGLLHESLPRRHVPYDEPPEVAGRAMDAMDIPW